MRIVPVLAALLLLVVLGALVPAAAAAPASDGTSVALSTEGTSVALSTEGTSVALSTEGASPFERVDDFQDDDRPVESCAAEPPEDFSNPDEDVIGWTNGFWYNEPFEVDQEDGLTEGELNALIARSQARFEVLRCLQTNRTPPVELQSREAFVEEQASLFENVSEGERRFDNAKFEALLMIGADEDSVDVREANRGAAVLGYYDPVSEQIVVIADGNDTLRMDELTLAHEIGHFVQDQQFDLLRFDGRLRDVSNAEDGLVEGDTHLIEHRYEQRCMEGTWDCVETEGPGDDGDLDLASEGLYLLNFQPYSDGPTFVETLYDRGGWAAVNDAYENPPSTSKHVVEPETYPEYRPANVTVTAAPDDQWERIQVPGGPDYDRIGQAGISSMFMGPTLETDGEDGVLGPGAIYNFNDRGGVATKNPLNYRFEATSGWNGDQFVAYRGPDNATGSIWTIEWASESDAAAFRDQYEDLLRYHGAAPVEDRKAAYSFGVRSEFEGGVAIVQRGATTTIVNAPSVDALSDLHPNAAPEIEPDDTDGPDENDGNSTLGENGPSMDDDGNASSTNDTNQSGNASDSADEVPGFGALAALLAVVLGTVTLLRRD